MAKPADIVYFTTYKAFLSKYKHASNITEALLMHTLVQTRPTFAAYKEVIKELEMKATDHRKFETSPFLVGHGVQLL